MKYYSEVTKSLYDTEKELHKAEEKLIAERNEREAAEKKKSAERKARADEVAAAREAAMAAQKKYNELLNAFVKDYGSYHMSVSNIKDVDDLVNTFLSWL